MGRCGNKCSGGCNKGCRKKSSNCYKGSVVEYPDSNKKECSNYYKGFEVECLKIKPGDSYDSIIKKLGDYICEQGFQEDGIDHISFIESTGTPSDQAGQNGETDTYVVWGDEKETNSLGTFVITNGSGGSSSVLYNLTAYVDRDNGDNFTAIVGRLDRPFKDIQTAVDSSSIVHVMPGNFSDDILVEADLYLYADTGVEFSGGGFTASGGAVMYVRGNLTFTGSSYAITTSETATADLEFDSINTSGFIFSAQGSSNVKMKFNSGICLGADFNRMGYCTEESNVDIKVRDMVETSYCVAEIDGGRNPNFTGTFRYECPTTKITGEEPYVINKCGYNLQNLGVCTVDIIGDTIYESGTQTPGIVYMDSPVGAPTNVTIRGDLRGQNTGGVHTTGIATVNLLVEGDIVVGGNPLSMSEGKDNESNIVKMRGSHISGLSSKISGGTVLYLDRCSSFTGTDNDPNIIYDSTSPNAIEIYSHNSYFESNPLNGTMVSRVAGATTASIYTVGTTSNNPMESGLVDVWGNLSIKEGFIVPKY